MARAGRIVHSVFHGLFFVLSSIAAGFTSVFFVDLVISYLERGTASEEDMLGIGISIAFLSVFIIIFAISGAALSLISTVLSAFLVKKSAGGRRVFGIISLVLSILYILLSVSSVIYMLLAAN